MLVQVPGRPAAGGENPGRAAGRFQFRLKGTFMKMEMRSPRRLALTTLTLSVSWLLSSCATKSTAALGTVGPKSATGHLTAGHGYLVVYSETQPMRLDKGIPYYVHTSYAVQTAHGRRVRSVANHVGDMDEAPQFVSLPAGAYQVLAHSTDYGLVRVPVVIEPYQTTKVHLEGKGSWKPQPPPEQDAELVRFSDGEPIGWQERAAQ